MPDLDEYRISELDSVASLNNGDLIEVAGVDAQTETGYRSVKVPMTQLGDKLLNGIDYVTDLQTTSKKVFGAINELKGNIDNLPKPIVLKGSLGTGGTISALPVDGSADIGDMYIVVTAGTYAGQASDVGDTFYCITKTASANTWTYVPSGDDYVEVTGTLTAGNTSITLSDASITSSSTIDIYTDVFGIQPTNAVVATGSITLTFLAQASDIIVKVRVS